MPRKKLRDSTSSSDGNGKTEKRSKKKRAKTSDALSRPGSSASGRASPPSPNSPKSLSGTGVSECDRKTAYQSFYSLVNPQEPLKQLHEEYAKCQATIQKLSSQNLESMEQLRERNIAIEKMNDFMLNIIVAHSLTALRKSYNDLKMKNGSDGVDRHYAISLQELIPHCFARMQGVAAVLGVTL